MSILEINKVDFISTEKESGKVVLTISDHLDWDDSFYHLSVLQEKINSYLRFIESEEIFQEYPNAIGKNLIIQISSKYKLNEEGNKFIVKVEAFLKKLNIEIKTNFLGN